VNNKNKNSSIYNFFLFDNINVILFLKKEKCEKDNSKKSIYNLKLLLSIQNINNIIKKTNF
jgi:hypothetical protein